MNQPKEIKKRPKANRSEKIDKSTINSWP